MKKFAVIFDLDGTVLNTDLLIKKSFEHVFKKYMPEHMLSEEEYLSFLGPTLVESFGRYFPQHQIDELVECYREYNHAHHHDYVTIYPHVKETLKYLKERGYPLAIVTTKYSRAAYIGLDMFDITKYFDVVIGMDQVNCVKPHPEGLLKVLEQTDSHRGVMIGDNPTDILAGKNAGMYTIGVKWTPKGTKAMEALQPDLMIDDMKEIVDFIERKGE